MASQVLFPGPTGDPDRYDDIIDLPHHQSPVHPHMSLHDRAAQFSPFAALTGYEDILKETARLTDPRAELSEEVLADLNRKLVFLAEHQKEHPECTVTWFLPDARKKGGLCRTKTGTVWKFDPYEKLLTLLLPPEPGEGSGTPLTIPVSDLLDLEGDFFARLETGEDGQDGPGS